MPDDPPKPDCKTCRGAGGWWEYGNGTPGAKPKQWISCRSCNGTGKR